MRRLLVSAAFVVTLAAVSGLLLAQSNPFLGTWKLNTAKSKYTQGVLQKAETITIQMVGDQDQVTVDIIMADGSPMTLKYLIPDAGGAGKVLAGPYEAVSGKRINASTLEISYMVGGKEIIRLHSVVSKDGKTLTVTSKGADLQGKPVSGVRLFEKQ